MAFSKPTDHFGNFDFKMSTKYYKKKQFYILSSDSEQFWSKFVENFGFHEKTWLQNFINISDFVRNFRSWPERSVDMSNLITHYLILHNSVHYLKLLPKSLVAKKNNYRVQKYSITFLRLMPSVFPNRWSR